MGAIHFHALSVAEAARALASDVDHGLDDEAAAARLARGGENVLPEPRRRCWPARFAAQLREPMAILLIVAAAVSGLGLKEYADGLAILAIVLLNAAIGVLQEGKAARSLAALRRMAAPRARVVRAGKVRELPARCVVPGDLVLLAAGDRVVADLRLVESTALEIDESLLTGESLGVVKDPGALAAREVPLAERRCMAFAGTAITRGLGRALVVATGAQTALGAIAGHLERPSARTPLERELGVLGRRLGALSLVVAALVFLLTVLRLGVSAAALSEAFLAAVALAVAAVPEGLPTSVTLALGLGVRRMAVRGAIVRRLPAVETLGSTTVILTDKTGTLTENRMSVERVLFADAARPPAHALPSRTADWLAEVAVLCNDASLDPPSGDPVDLALLEAMGQQRVSQLRSNYPRRSALPFSSAIRRMTVLCRMPGGQLLLLTKGAPEVVLPRCDAAITSSGRLRPLDEAARRTLLDRIAADARTGRRLIALARRQLTRTPPELETSERALTLVGVVALRDAPRREAARTIAEARAAGIRVVMVTGDHSGTAAWVASQVGLLGSGDRVLTGAELRRDGLPPDPLAIPVYARVDPDQKVALVEAARAGGQVVAVTGDGVNDAPALRRADIGVAMGRSGTDVARSAADLVVTDDNLATVVAAVREGRAIYDNLRKVVDYLVAGNLSEILIVSGGLVLFPALGVPLLPLQLLWINLLTDGIPALALGVDPPTEGLMRRAPRRVGDRLLAVSRLARLGGRALLMAAVALGSLAIERHVWDEPWSHARAVTFTVVVITQLLYAFVVHGGAHGNRWLWLAVGLGLALQVVVTLWPPAGRLLHTAPLLAREWALTLVAGALPTTLLLVGRVLARVARPVESPLLERPAAGPHGA